MPFSFASQTDTALPLFVLEESALGGFLSSRSAAERAWLASNGFKATLGQLVLLPGADGLPVGAAFGWGSAAARRRGRFHLAAAASQLPEGTWRLEADLPPADLQEAALGWLLAQYRFDRYRARPATTVRLVAPTGIDVTRIAVMAEAEGLTRDLINTPASDMGPDEIETAFADLAARFGARTGVVRGDDLIAQNFPMIHAVGRASPRAPRIMDMRWGSRGPRLTLVGKGVCFDTGGLDLKPSAGMGLMKKDMGGAATVLGLAQMIMALDMPLQLRVIIPAVENAVAGNAFRPQDILTSRKGLTVEINNTDAEGRLILGDALAWADEEETDLIVSMATLTGAARTAVGPDLAPFYTDSDALAAALSAGAIETADPVWRMPFWDPYENLIEPGIADLDNAPSGGFAGSITAALFLRRFVTRAASFAHFDIYGWQPTAAPARPKGGAGQAARAILAALPKALAL